MKTSLILITIILLTGCSKTPIGIEQTSNSTIQVDLLFEKDGVKVYRFTDYGRPIYYTDARGSTQWSESRNNGKQSYSVTRNVPTAQ